MVLFRISIVVLLTVLAASEAPGQRKKGRGRQNLPGALCKLPASQYGMLDQLLDRAMRWVGGAEPMPTSDDAGNFFGRVVLPVDENAPGAPPPVEFGLFVLGGLDNAQIRLLSDLARGQLADVRQYEAKHREMRLKAAALRDDERPPRDFQRDISAMGKELGEIEARMGLAQATAFIQLRSLLADDQIEYFLLLRRNPTLASVDNPGVVRIRPLADKLEAAHRKQVMAVAERSFLYLTGTAAQNVSSLRTAPLPDPESEEAERKMGFLKVLNPAQLGQLAALLGAESRAQAEADAKRTQIAATLDLLKQNKRIEERHLAAAAKQMGELQAKLEILDAEALERLRGTLSGAQRAFITRNILVGGGP